MVAGMRNQIPKTQSTPPRRNETAESALATPGCERKSTWEVLWGSSSTRRSETTRKP